MARLPSSAWSVEGSAKQRHDRSGFDCGVPVLNERLTTQVSRYEKKDLARTYVLLPAGQHVVKGFYTLSSHTVVHGALAEGQAKGSKRLCSFASRFS